jgi:hypothetical protein
MPADGEEMGPATGPCDPEAQWASEGDFGLNLRHGGYATGPVIQPPDTVERRIEGPGDVVGSGGT